MVVAVLSGEQLENLMYASNDPASPDYNTIKLVDFGFSKCFGDHGVMKTACGSPWNVAPEVVDPNLEHGDGYGPEVDLWSVGVILYSMLCGFPPFYSDSNPVLIKQIRTASYRFHSPYWDEVSFGAKDLVSNLLVVRPCRRFTCHQCLEHPWIKHAGDDSSRKLHSSYRSFMLLRKLAIFDNLDPACLEDVAGRLQAVKAPAGEFVVRAGDAGDAMYFVNAGAVQVQVDGLPSDRLGAGSFFGEAALTAVEEHFADVVSLGATSGVRCDPQGSPLGRRRADPAELFRLTRADFEAVAERFPALEDRLHDVGMARVRRACSPQCSPVRALRRCNFRAQPAGAPAGGRSSPTRFGFLLTEGLGSAVAGEAGEGGAVAAKDTITEGRRLSDLLIDGDEEEEEEVDGRFMESWAPSGSCPSSPKASPGGNLWSPRRRMSDALIDDDDDDEEAAGPDAATLSWGGGD